MSYGSPYGGTPLRGDPSYYYDVNSPSPTPSPQHYQFYPVKTPQRPATRAHHRGVSSGFNDYRPSTAFSPRYKSTGEYATGPSPQVSPRKHSFSKGTNHHQSQRHHQQPQHHHHHHTPKRERRRSHSYYRASHGDSDEDEYFEVDGVTYVLPAESRSRKYSGDYHYDTVDPSYGADYHYSKQAYPSYYEKEKTEYVRQDDLPPRSSTRMGHHPRPRRSSGAVPPIQRSATVRPSSSHQKKPPPSAPKATEADARRHNIAAGYSLKNWDPTEDPILLLGSVFDSNSLGKWIYDWTVYHHGPSTPMADVAGELWLLLIQLSGKVKRSEEALRRIRAKENKEMVVDFIESGERLTAKLGALLKRCEAPMLKASKRREAAQLGKNSGVEFVETLFGRERELPKTEQFMQQVRLWNLRFDANCEDILQRPTQ